MSGYPSTLPITDPKFLLGIEGFLRAVALLGNGTFCDWITSNIQNLGASDNTENFGDRMRKILSGLKTGWSAQDFQRSESLFICHVSPDYIKYLRMWLI